MKTKGFIGARQLRTKRAVDPNAEKAEPNRKNAYHCGNCGHWTVTIDIHEGVTPFMIGCPNCKTGIARSSFYDLETAKRAGLKDSKPTHEWYKPLPGTRLAHGPNNEGLALRRIK